MTTNSTSTSAPSSVEVVVVSFRHFQKNTLRGFVTLSLSPPGITIHDCTFHVTDDGRSWFGWPARTYTTKEGKQEWARIIEASDKSSHFKLQAQCCRAIQQFLARPQEHAFARTAKPMPQSASKHAGPPRAQIPAGDIPI